MKINELRIGNWTYYPRTQDELYQIIYPRQIELAYILKPIPLTSEWLKRCGFVSTLGGDDFHSDIIWDDPKSDYHYCEAGYFVDNRGDYGHYCDIGDIKYVHEFQNLYFALTGQELNFKDQ